VVKACTIHFVNEHYDEGAILFQVTCDLTPQDLPADIERKVRALETEHFPSVITAWIERTWRHSHH
jgi:phosphoribosylglycinamide formyltransferase 1